MKTQTLLIAKQAIEEQRKRVRDQEGGTRESPRYFKDTAEALEEINKKLKELELV